MITEFLGFKIIHVGDYSLSVYQILTVILILFLARFIFQVSKRLMRRALSTKKTVEEGRLYAFEQFLKYLITVFALLLSLQSVGVNLSLVLAGSAALMVGIGLGLQHMFNDVVSGIILLSEGNISVGDDVEVDGKTGKVVRINIRTTHILKRDGTVIIEPNSKLTTNGLINWNHTGAPIRFNVKIGVAYGSDVEKIRVILLNIAKEHPNVETKVSPFVRFASFGDSSLDFELHFFTKQTTTIDNTLSDMRFSINKEFELNDITIPFPQRDVWLRK